MGVLLQYEYWSGAGCDVSSVGVGSIEVPVGVLGSCCGSVLSVLSTAGLHSTLTMMASRTSSTRDDASWVGRVTCAGQCSDILDSYRSA